MEKLIRKSGWKIIRLSRVARFDYDLLLWIMVFGWRKNYSIDSI